MHGERSAKSFTALFTARDGGVPMSSAAGCEPSPTCYRSHELLGRWGRCGEGLERREFSPGLPEVISIALKDRPRPAFVEVFSVSVDTLDIPYKLCNHKTILPMCVP